MAQVSERPGTDRIQTERLELFPLSPEAAAALPDERERAAELIGATLPADWPHADLLDALPMHAAAAARDDARFGVWVIVERESDTVVGDIGFFGPPTPEGTVEIGYSVVDARRRRGYATEAATALVGWAKRQPNVHAVLARCDDANEPSMRTLERLGFARTGRIDELLAWRL
jgi:[ribosomal protein S5]-alanine N-acetyltransferase